MVCANEVVRWSCQGMEGVKAFYHSQGCTQTSPDLERVTRTLISLGHHPNLAGVVVMGLGCESVDPETVADAISASGKPVETVVLQKSGGAVNASQLARSRIEALRAELLPGRREEIGISSLLLGIKCGGSDATSGIISNPALGKAVDRFLDMGGSVAFGETTELIGAEDGIVSRGRTRDVRRKLMDTILGMEERAKRMGVDMRGGQPTGGNIRSGLSTIEEKSLGAAIKTGSRPIEDVIQYGDRISTRGLHMVDTPGREPEFLTGIAASGAQVMAFTTGMGAPHGFPFMPIVKITGNPGTARDLEVHIDVDVSPVLTGELDMDAAGDAIFREILEVASGRETKAERLGYDESMNIYITGPVI